jgi:hypothetical protein
MTFAHLSFFRFVLVLAIHSGACGQPYYAALI